MEQAMQALGGLFLKALPTFLLVILLHFYLKAMLYGPIEKILKERDAATAGNRRAAEESLARADQKAREYEQALREARGEVYREQDEFRRQRRQEHAAAIEQARAQAAAAVADARRSIEMDTAAAMRSLDAQAEVLADRIAESAMGRRAA
jgi:F-type H+-transporting ATPase subunit b